VGSSASANQTGPVPFVFGGRLCLDFANTVNCRTRPASRDYLPDYPALVEWAHQLGIIDDGSLSGLKDRGAAEPDLARKTFASAIELRETVDRLFRAVAESAQPSERDLAILNRWLRSGRAEQRLAAASPNFVWESVGIAPDPRLPLWAVASSAADLLTREDLRRVKACPGPVGCGWLFFDDTKNRSRRWCSMEYCGSAAKAKRQGERRRSG
jgi:predicted RNA-binding Zn ribbon-like protein